MDLYLPIANLSVNALVIIGLGGVVGLLSGMFGVGGGFLTTPLLIFYGIPPTVAAASAASQVTGASVSGVVTHMSRGTVDFRMGGVLIAGGVVGAGLGVLIFRLLQSLGQIDTVIGILYVLMLGGIGSLAAVGAGFQPVGADRRSSGAVDGSGGGQAWPAPGEADAAAAGDESETAGAGGARRLCTGAGPWAGGTGDMAGR